MRFLAFTWGVPLLGMLLLAVAGATDSESATFRLFGPLFGLWILANFPITFCYLLARVVWRARRDAQT